MKKIMITLLLIIPCIVKSQHTFSIVAVDPITGEIGSAGATCADSKTWPGTSGALIISDVIPGVGAIHTQSYYNPMNQIQAHKRMEMGESPDEIIQWLVAHDVSSDPSIRQYGIVDFNGGNPRASAYTGAKCFDYKNHILGSNYAIQGNILLGEQILNSMERGFKKTTGSLADKLMAAMQGAKVIGADVRCAPEGTSSLSAFLRVAKPTDGLDSLSLDLIIASTPDGVEPIDMLQAKYNFWKINNSSNPSPVLSIMDISNNNHVAVYLNPTNGSITIEACSTDITKISITDTLETNVMSKELQLCAHDKIDLSVDDLKDGTYIMELYNDTEMVSRKILLHKTK